MDTTRVVGSKLKMYALIGDDDLQWDITAYNATFELNNIPSGSVMLPVGYSLGENGRAAEIMTRLNNFRSKQKIQVFLQIDADETEYGKGIEKFKGNKPVLIFEGKISGAILKRGHNSLYVMAHFVHWLAELNNSSVLSGNSHVTNPLVLYQEGAQNYAGGAGTGTGADPNDACAFTTEPQWTITNTNAFAFDGSQDIWEGMLKPFLSCVIKSDSLDNDLQQFFNTDASKKRRLDALNKINTGGIVLKKTDNLDVVASALRADLTSGIKDVAIANTIWGLIISYWAPSYFLVIVPRVEDAIVASVVGSYRDSSDQYLEIAASDYYAINVNLSSRQSISTVAVFANPPNGTGAELTVNWPFYPGIYPDFPPVGDTTKLEGILLVKSLPNWLNAIPDELDASAAAEKPETAFDPTAAAVAAAVATAEQALREKNETQKSLAKLFAKFYYVNEIFNNRSGEISGKLRFDIAPGSNVRVQTVALGSDYGKFESVYGMVVRVSYTIDATQGTASTVFTLSNLRIQSELDDTTLSIAESPLYTSVWPGGPLLK